MCQWLDLYLLEWRVSISLTYLAHMDGFGRNGDRNILKMNSCKKMPKKRPQNAVLDRKMKEIYMSILICTY